MASCAGTSRKRKLNVEDGEQGPPPRPKLRIEDLPDELIGAIVSRLPLKEGARSQVLSSRWRSIGRGDAQINLDSSDLGSGAFDVGDLTMDYILSRYSGPGRRFTLRASSMEPRPTAAKVDTWLRSPALRELQQLQLRFDKRRLPPSEQPPDAEAMILEPLPEAVLMFESLKILDLVSYSFPDAVEGTPFKSIIYLTLEHIRISETLFVGMINECPCLKSVLLSCIMGMDTIRISSNTIRCVGLHVGPRIRQEPPVPPADKLVIANCPMLQRLLKLDERRALHTTIRNAPMLQVIGFISDGHRIKYGPSSTINVIGSFKIQALQIDSLVAGLCGVRILAISMEALDIDMTVNMLRCFPSLERLYIQCVSGGKENRWQTKYKNFAVNMCLKVVVLNEYRGTQAQSRVASFFLQKAGVLDLMVLGISRQNNSLEFHTKQLNSICYAKRISAATLVRFRSALDGCFLYASQFRSANDIDYPDPFMDRS